MAHKEPIELRVRTRGDTTVVRDLGKGAACRRLSCTQGAYAAVRRWMAKHDPSATHAMIKDATASDARGQPEMLYSVYFCPVHRYHVTLEDKGQDMTHFIAVLPVGCFFDRAAFAVVEDCNLQSWIWGHLAVTNLGVNAYPEFATDGYDVGNWGQLKYRVRKLRRLKEGKTL